MFDPPYPGMGMHPKMPDVLPLDQVIRVLEAVQEIADKEGLEISASFGQMLGMMGSAPLQVTLVKKRE